MIIKGGAAGNVGWWSKHLLRDDTNERVEVKEIKGLNAENLRDALWEMKWVAAGSKSQGNFMYQANINPRADEHLTPEQWQEAVETLEKNMGFEGHQRVVIEHVKDGRQHYHIIWNRVDVETMKVADIGGNYRIHEATARELEQRFDHTPTPSPVPGVQRTGEELWEKRAAERSGIDPAELKAELTELWRASDSGQAFRSAIEERGYVLARGDRRDFCVVDAAGDAHSLARRLEGVKTAEVRVHMADVDRDALPSVEEARGIQRGRAAEAGAEPAPEPESFWERRLRENRVEAREADAAPTPGFESGHDEVFSSRADRERDQGVTGSAEVRSQASEGDDSSEAFSAGSRDAGRAATGFERAGFGVFNAATGGVEKVADFVADFLAGGGSKPKTTGDIGEEQADRIEAQRRALAALASIRESIQNGRTLRPEDLKNLAPNHLENIAAKGDSFLLDLIRRWDEEERERAAERGRQRER